MNFRETLPTLILLCALSANTARAQGIRGSDREQLMAALSRAGQAEGLARVAPRVAQAQADGLSESTNEQLPWFLLQDSDLLRFGPEIPFSENVRRSLDGIRAALAHAERIDPNWQPVAAHRNSGVIASYRYLPTGGLYSFAHDGGFTHEVVEGHVPPATVIDTRRVHGPVYDLGAAIGAEHRVGGGHIHTDQAPYRRSPARLVTMIARFHNEPWYTRIYNPGSYPGLTFFERGMQAELRYGVQRFRASAQTWDDFLQWIGPLIFSKNSFLRLGAETLEFRGISPAFTISQLERREFFLQRMWDSSDESVPELVEWDVTRFAQYLSPTKENVHAFRERAFAELGIDLIDTPYRADFADMLAVRKTIQRGKQEYTPREVDSGVDIVDWFFTLRSERDVAQFLSIHADKIQPRLVLTLASGFFTRHPQVWRMFSEFPRLTGAAFYRAPRGWWLEARFRSLSSKPGAAIYPVEESQTWRRGPPDADELRIAMQADSAPRGMVWLEAMEAIDRDPGRASDFLGQEILQQMYRIAEQEYLAGNSITVTQMRERMVSWDLDAPDSGEGATARHEAVMEQRRALLQVPLGALAEPERRAQLDQALGNPKLVSFALSNLVGSELDGPDSLPLGYIAYALRNGKFAECNELLMDKVRRRL